MRPIFFLGPGHYVGDPSLRALAERRRFASFLAPRQAIIMEDAVCRVEESDAQKFLRLASAVGEFLIWLPEHGRLPTVFSELVALRFRREQHGKRLAVFYENDVLDATGRDFHVNAPDGRIAYLRDLRDFFDVRTWRFETTPELERLLSWYGQGLLEDA